jgi:hypothetical protein
MKELDNEIMISYDDSVISHKILFEKLFEKGLVPKTEPVIEGIMEFFRYTFFEQYPDQSGVDVARSMVDALVSVLMSSNYKVVAVASTVLRHYINTFDEIPTNCIQKLVEALDANVPTSASQVALTLGCIACSKPDIGVLKEIIIPLHDIDFPLCHNCGGSFNRIENADCVVPHLMTHLNRPKSRDRSRKVRRACAIALGEIAYTNPESVLKAMQPLGKFIKEEKASDAIVFALGCIGYTRPDLVEDFVQKFEKASKVYYGNISMASRSAFKKIGMETNALLNSSITGKRDLETTVDIFFERMKKYDGRLVGESVFALKDLAIKFPEEVIDILNKKIKVSSGCLEQNICRTYSLISEYMPYKLKETIPILVEHFTNRSYGYISINSSASALIRILKNQPKLIPHDLEEILITFLKYEKRDSVIHHAKLLLTEIKNW